MKTVKVMAIAVCVLLVSALPAFAEGSNTLSGAGVGVGIGVAVTMIGAGMGFGRIGAAALESMARQPEVAARVQLAMLIIAALLEGATFFALIVCLLLSNKVEHGL